MNRKKEIIDYLTECLDNSALAINNMPAVKYLCGKGTVVFLTNNRMIDLCEVQIPNYDKETDERIIYEILNSSKYFDYCESHDYKDTHYVYSIYKKN